MFLTICIAVLVGMNVGYVLRLAQEFREDEKED